MIALLIGLQVVGMVGLVVGVAWFLYLVGEGR